MSIQYEAQIVSDKRKISLFFILVSVAFLIIAIAIISWYVLQWNLEKKESLFIETEMAQIIADAQNTPFAFTAVPNALELISLPPPTNTNEIDLAKYKQVKAANFEVGYVPEDDVIFNQAFMGTTYGEYLNMLKNPDEIYQITDELHQIALQFNVTYNRPPLKERIAGVEQMSSLDPISMQSNVRSVYPSIRAIDAYLGAEIMSMQDPENALTYKQKAQALIDRGIGYGLYGESDAEAALSVVSQYLEIYRKNQEVLY